MPKKTKATFASHLRQLRDGAGLSQRELAARAGITQAAYQRLESGQAEPRLSSLQQLAAALGVTVGQLAGDAC